MQGNFNYCNPTRLYFGKDSLNYLPDELKKYGPIVMLSYGGGSIKRNGIYDAVTAILREEGKTIVEDGGVMPNPTTEKLNEGVKIARENKVDLLLRNQGLRQSCRCPHYLRRILLRREIQRQLSGQCGLPRYREEEGIGTELRRRARRRDDPPRRTHRP